MIMSTVHRAMIAKKRSELIKERHLVDYTVQWDIVIIKSDMETSSRS